ncbi:MAG: ABC transporter permease [Eubacterium sp.]|jgi:peptide/nickel transport system permease protein|nr:ABC transporter permease [Eubacterium sp.]
MKNNTSNIKNTRAGMLRFWRYTVSHPIFAFGLLIVLCNLALMVLAPYITPYPPEVADPFNVRQAPSAQHIFGTDPSGMDVFSRVIYAPRIDLTIALAGTSLSLLAGIFLGAAAGFWKNWFTEGIQRICDLLQAFPPFVLAMALVAVTGQKIENVIYVIAFLNIPIYMRLVRSDVMSVKDHTFVEAAVCSGGSGVWVLFTHILPNVVGSALTQASVNIGWAILLTSGLSFIGAGVPVPTPEWGAMIAVGAPTIITGEWWSSLFPGIAIALTALGFSLTGDGLQEFLDPTRRS